MPLQATANKHGVWCQGEWWGWFLISNLGVPLGLVGRKVKLGHPRRGSPSRAGKTFEA